MKRFLAIIVTLGGVVAASLAQPGEAPAHWVPAVATEQPVQSSAGLCIPCHKEFQPTFKDAYDLILKDSIKDWQTKDPHASAARAIDPEKNELAKKMERILGCKVKNQPECLVCHAVDLELETPLDKKTKFAWEFGVGCEACHGKADDWEGPHKRVAWRAKSPDEKLKLGQIDLRDPSLRAAKCVTCHVGSLKEGKFVTHEMYAAGHPPLLPFEAATFARDQPAHWSPPEDMPYIRNLPADSPQRKFFHAPAGELSAPRAVAEGAIVTLRDSVRLVASAAERSGDAGMLDFAHYDCFACHHELELPSRRQLRGYPGTPGRPTVRPLPSDLVGAVMAHAQSTGVAEMHSALMELNSAFDRRAFGDAAAIAMAGNRFVGIMDKCLGDLHNVRYDEAGRQKLLAALLATGKPAMWDYDVAQQQAWAARTLSGQAWPELSKSVLLNAGIPPDANVQKLLKDRLKVRYGFDAVAFDKIWKTLLP